MGDWLASLACTHVAMESTGVYWKPVWHALEGRFELVPANDPHRRTPGLAPLPDRGYFKKEWKSLFGYTLAGANAAAPTAQP